MKGGKEFSGILEVFDGGPAHRHNHVLEIVDLAKLLGDPWKPGALQFDWYVRKHKGNGPMSRGLLQLSFQFFEVSMPELVKSGNLPVLKEV
jgi:hypothetical protein